MYTYLCTCLYVCVCAWKNIVRVEKPCVYVCAYVCVYVCVFAYTCVCNAFWHINIHLIMHPYTQASFPAKSPVISGCFVKKDLQLYASCASSPHCIMHPYSQATLQDRENP